LALAFANKGVYNSFIEMLLRQI